MCINCAPLIAIVFINCYERDYMSDLHKSKLYDIIIMLKIPIHTLPIYALSISLNWRKIFPIYIQQSFRKTNQILQIDWQTSFLDLDIKVIGSDVYTSVNDKRGNFGSPIENFPLLSGDVPWLLSYGIHILQLVRYARCCSYVSDFYSKNL